MAKKKIFIIDVTRCNGCHACQVACKDEHAGNDWTPYARPQPETGQFWLRLEQEVRGTVPKVRVAYRPHLCMHCDEAPCRDACPAEGAIYKRTDGLVIIDPEKCTGCRLCMDACPFHTIYFNEGLNIAQKCTGCAHLLDEGWKEPRCADACPTGAIRLADEEKEAPGQAWKPELKVKPRVSYKGLPGRFIAGTVYDPKEKEVVIGAACVLTDAAGRALEEKTDDFGDFWFEDLDEGKFGLEIRMDGKTTSFASIDTTGKDVNLGDIPLV